MSKNKEKQRLNVESLSFDDYSSDNISFGYPIAQDAFSYTGKIETDPLSSVMISVCDPKMKINYSGIDYKYNEGKILEEIRQYINNTYGEHYSQNNYQATEFIIDGGHGIGFTIGNILKYAQRYGHKGNEPEWRKDLMKVIHYAIIALHVHDLNNKG